MTRSARDRVEGAAASLPWLREGIVVHGWRLAGPGPARHGWWYQHVTGACTWLGPTAEAVVRRAELERVASAAEPRWEDR